MIQKSVFIFLLTAIFSLPSFAEVFQEAPRVRAALEQGEAAEKGRGMHKNLALAVTLYCDAATMGSSEGFFRIGRLLANAPGLARNKSLANAYFALAASLGHHEAFQHHDEKIETAALGDQCDPRSLGGTAMAQALEPFNIEAYLSRLSAPKRKIAQLIHKLAPRYNIDPRVALAIAMAESNLDAGAVSPKNAQGVMQLIPETQQRFGVTRPFDPEQNIKGAMAYLAWLKKRFAGDWHLVAAAYNAGEGAVDRYRGIPPYAETQQYVRRVMHFAGIPPARVVIY